MKKIRAEFQERFIINEEQKEESKVAMEIKKLTESVMSVMQKVI